MALADPLDYFSDHALDYAKFRPDYPKSLFEFLGSLLKYRGVAWDAACGNGQIAAGLSSYFQLICASDISPQQIAAAPADPNILYSVQRAEKTDFPDQYFDLIVVAQALHWFDLDAFYQEVNRVLHPGGKIVVLGYGLVTVRPDIDLLIQKLYSDIVGDFWPKERFMIETGYKTLSFPFEESVFPALSMDHSWTVTCMIGYLRTWSAVKKYLKANGRDPVQLLQTELENKWGRGALPVSFPLFGRVGTRS